MQKTFEEIRNQIHEIRSFLGPVDMKLAGLDHRLAEMRVLLEERFTSFESRLVGNSFKFGEQDSKIAELSDRVNWIEQMLKVPPRPARKLPSPPKNPDP